MLSIDYLLVQKDINAISEWVSDNYLFLNFLKCYHLLISRKRIPTLPDVPLMINGNAINNVIAVKYLGAILTSNFSWSNHISPISSKARKLIGVLYRKFYHHSDPQTLLRLYQSLIHPHLKYACSIWDPHLKKNIEMLESVQKFGLKVCLKQWHSTCENLSIIVNMMCTAHLSLSSLQELSVSCSLRPAV